MPQHNTTALYASNLTRTMQTAKEIALTTGHTPIMDKIIHIGGTSRSTHTEIIEVNQDNIVKALETNDYQTNYYFEQGSVTVEEFENV